MVDWNALVEEGVIGPADIELITWCETAEEAWGHIAAFYELDR